MMMNTFHDSISVTQRLENLNRKAGALRHWGAVRYSSSLLKQMVDSISPFVTQILVNGKQVSVSRDIARDVLAASPVSPLCHFCPLNNKSQLQTAIGNWFASGGTDWMGCKHSQFPASHHLLRLLLLQLARCCFHQTTEASALHLSVAPKHK